MALRGTLESFPPSEILQFLTNSRRTGTLRVYDDTHTKLLAFRKGQLVYAVHQRRMAPLRDVILHRGHADAGQLPSAREQQGWDEVMTRALARRRNLEGSAPHRERRRERLHESAEDAQLGRVLIAQGRITEQQLQAALAPEAIPEKLLVAGLLGAGLLTEEQLLTTRALSEADGPLLATLLAHQRVTREDVVEVVRRMSDESLAELLVFHGLVGRTEALHCLNQLSALHESLQPGVRIGEYLLAKGLVSQSQLQRALFDQVAREHRLGEALVEQGVITRQVLEENLQQAAAINADFGPMHSLQLEQAAAGRGMTADELRRIVQTVLVDELCDLVLWSEAQFEFLEGFSLEHVLSRYDLPDFAFDVQSLLLETHSLLDELRRTPFGDVSASMVLTAGAAADAIAPAEQPGILRRLDGRTPLEEVCAVLPGNRFSHLLLFTELVAAGLARPLTRAEAHAAGRTAAGAGRSEEAACLFRHALATAGDEPPDAELRTALRDAEWSSDRHPLGFLVLGIKHLLRAVGLFGGYERLRQRIAESRTLGRIRAGAIAPARRLLRRGLARTGGAVESVLIRTGLARHVWSLKARVAPVLRRLPGFDRGSPASGRLALAAVGVVALAYLLPGVPDLPHDGSLGGLSSGGTVERRAPVGAYAVGHPVDVPPTLAAEHIYVASRDGKVHALRRTGAAPVGAAGGVERAWELEVGEFGDILNQPVVAGRTVFVTTVPGRVVAITTGGRQKWSRDLPRLEPIRPVVIRDARSALVGLAVVSRASLLVLAPDDGRTLFELTTGNRITTPPICDASTVIVGSSDNHVYAAAWRSDELLWDHEERDDIIAVVRADGRVVFAARDGSLGALDVGTGRALWRRNFERNSIREVWSPSPGRFDIVTTSGGVTTLEAAGGLPIGDYQPAPALDVARLHRGGSRLVYASSRGYLGELGDAGMPRWQASTAVGDVAGWACDDDVLVVTDRSGKVLLFPLDAGAGETPRGRRP